MITISKSIHDEQSKLRKAEVLIRAKSWALILIAIGILMVLLA